MDQGELLAGEGAGEGQLVAAPAAATDRQAPKSYRELFSITWKLMLVTMILGLHKEVDTQILTPYLYTRVQCCGSEPGPPWSPAVQRPGEPPLRAAMDYGDHIVWLNVTAKSWCARNCTLLRCYRVPSVAHRPAVLSLSALI